MCGERGTGLDLVEAGGHVCWSFGLGADGVEVGGDVGGSWRAGVEGNVLVAGALVDGEGDEGGGHLLCVSQIGVSRFQCDVRKIPSVSRL